MTTLVSTKAKTFTISNPFAGWGVAIMTAFEKSAEKRALRSLQNFSDAQLASFGTSHADLKKRIRNV